MDTKYTVLLWLERVNGLRGIGRGGKRKEIEQQPKDMGTRRVHFENLSKILF